MADAPLWYRLLPPALRRLPADLAAVAGLTLLTVLAALLPGVRETPLRVVLGLPFVLFLPGYAFVAALFPERGPRDRAAGDGAAGDTGAGEGGADSRADAADTAPGRDGGIDGIERVALSFGLSIAVVPLIGLVLNFTPWGIRLVPILVGVAGFTLAATAVATRRRRALPAEERFAVPYRSWLAAARGELLEPETNTDAALNVLLALSVVLALSSVAYAVAVPKQGESFTEFYLLTETEEGDLVADDYPTEFERGETRPIVVGIGNQEHEAVEYTVVVVLQRVTVRNNTTLVEETRELDRFGTRLAHNETWQRTYRITPTMTGTRLRLAFLLYRGTVPATPSVDSAYRETHLWINVTAAG